MDKPTITLARNKCYVDGQWIGEPKLPVTNKATGDIMARVPELGEAETRAAIEAANRALPGWSKLLAKERARLVRRWYDLIVEHADELALLLTNEQGKPLAEARGEILYAAGFIEFAAEEAKRIYGETIPSFKADARVVVIKQPVGVVAAITPWNFPAAMITRKAGPALAVGCTMVLKPASETPLTALALAVLAERAGIPKGVFNVITGKASVIGKELTANPIVRMLTFTGSTEIGAKLMAQCAPTVKKLGLELGGNAPFIVFDDADLDKAVAGAMASKYRNAGQTCVCANRIYVQAGVYDAFAEKLAQQVKKMKVGAGTEEGVTTGPLINKAAIEKVEEHVADALKKGAKVALGGKRHERGGNFYRAHHPHRRHAGHDGGARGDLRARGAAVQVQDRGRRDRDGQRHAVRPRRLLLFARHRPGVARGRGAGVRHHRHQRGHHLQRGGAVRRLQAVGPRARGLPPRRRGVPRDQVHADGRPVMVLSPSPRASPTSPRAISAGRGSG